MHRRMQSTTMTRLSLALLLTFAYFDLTDAHYDLHDERIPKSCKHPNETIAATKLRHVCRDCYDLFKVHVIGELCRENCYSGVYLPACVKALHLWDEKDNYREWVEKLSDNKFVVWDDTRVELLNVVSTATTTTTTTKGPVVHSNRTYLPIMLDILLPVWANPRNF